MIGNAQELDSSQAYEQLRMVRAKHYNDLYQYWYKSDRNYSDGLTIQFFHPIFESKWGNFILLGRKTEIKDYAVLVDQDLFTPTDTKADSVLYNDRPYAAFLYGGYSKFTNDIVRGVHVNSSIYLGICGPPAFGEEMQNGVHEKLNNPSANGWANQIGTGLILDYETWYQKALPLSSPATQLTAVGRFHVGTILNYIEGGFRYRFGRFNEYFMNDMGFNNYRNTGKDFFKAEDFEHLSKARKQSIPRRLRSQPVEQQIAYLNTRMERKFQCYGHLGISAIYIGYDGTLEGSLIPFETSVITQPTTFEDPLLVVAQYGVHFQINRFTLNFIRFIENDVLNIKSYFGYGELDLGFVF